MVEKIIKNNNLKIFFIYIINMNKKEINENSFKYIIDQTKFIHEKECILNNTYMIQNNFRSIIRPNVNLVDIESKLTNRSRYLSKCPTKLFNPKQCEKNSKCLCDKCSKINSNICK
tara:strand:- start:175 stop:522 length:348 start_codon:yes stop_codon:yes gene_type:complete